MKSLKIVVLCGGLSTERYISLLSGSRVCAALRRRGHRAVLADLFLGFENGEGMDEDPARGEGRTEEGIFDPEILFRELPPITELTFDGKETDLETVRESRKYKGPALFGQHVLELCRAADIVFMALHGKNGEDGRVQATFDTMGIPYTGSGYLGSALAMDKIMTKMLVGPRGVRTPAFRRWEFSTSEFAVHKKGQRGPEKEIKAREAFVLSVCRQTDVPCVVKTPEGGSSLGVYIVREKEALEKAVRTCLAFGNVLMTEQYIEGRELTCAVLCGRALPSVEIVPKTSFYDYSNKYIPGATEEICPADLPAGVEKEMGEMALRVHETLGLNTYSRSDFILDQEGRLWFLEVNTLPGMTRTSLVPQEAAAVGISYEELCETVIEDALRIRTGKTF
ncbi:MAG: D-alanine--D-alanine ligase [Eubacteriales bacterium]|nr:D-alanine--D-alanine ligase [Eubacteriales bacterium]